MHRRFRLPLSLRQGEKRNRLPAPRRVAAPGTVRIALRPRWEALFADLAAPGFGSVWRITRNRHASLGLRSPGGHPPLRFSPGGLLAVDAAGTIAAEFPFWHRAWGVETEGGSQGGDLHAAEFEDDRGDVFHKICLSGGACPAPFATWVRAHRDDAANDPDPRPRRVPIAVPPAPALPGALHLPGSLLRETLLAASQADIVVHAVIHTEGLRQAGAFRPLHVTESNGWLRLLGADAALFVEAEPSGLLRVEPRPVEGETGWRVTLVHPDGRRWLELASGPDDRAAWNQIMSERLLRQRETGA